MMTSSEGYITLELTPKIQHRSAKQCKYEASIKSSLSVKNHLDPQLYLMNLLCDEADMNMEMIYSLSFPEDYYIPNTDENIQAYNNDIVSAVRRDDLDTLKQLKEQGRNFQCRNKAGESLVHIACRRGATEVVRFLLEAGCSVRVKDDCGRTPFHDALWVPRPNFDLFELLIHQDAKLILAKDNRGFYPFAYAPRDNCEDWIQFLKKNKIQLCRNLSATM